VGLASPTASTAGGLGGGAGTGSTGRVLTAGGLAISRGGKADRGVGAASSSAGRGSAARLESAAAIVEPGIIGTGVSARAGAAACAGTGADSGGGACAVTGADIGGGSGHPASGGMSILEGESSATGPSPAGVAGSGAAVRASAAWDGILGLAACGASVGAIRMLATAALAGSGCRDAGEGGVPVRSVGMGGRDGVERLAGRSRLTSGSCGLTGAEGTRSTMLTRDVSAPRDHGGA
jgi:hypothetical protein